MTTTHEPAFSSPELQSALNDARPSLEGADEARNRVSDDIRALERYLVGLQLKASFRYSLGKILEPDNEQGVAGSLEYSGYASGHIREEVLAFDVDATGKQRLLFEVHRWEGYVDIDMPGGPYFCEPGTEQVESRPLIESKFEVRKSAYPRLPDFLRCLGKSVAIEPLEFVRDDIPF